MKIFRLIFIAATVISQHTFSQDCGIVTEENPITEVNEQTKPFTPENPSFPTNTETHGSSGQTGDRLIFFVHGLGGDQSSWFKAANATSVGAAGFPARKAICFRPTYSQFNLKYAGFDLNEAMYEADKYNTPTNRPTRNFIIAHSQGGIVSRKLDMLYGTSLGGGARRFGGLVTFGTPHQGAMILNNKDLFYKFGTEGCSSLLAGPAAEVTSVIFSLNLIDKIMIDLVEKLTVKACDNNVENAIAKTMGAYDQPITEGYRVGSEELNKLNEYNSTIPKVAFYGEEEDPVFWRTMYSLTIDDINSHPAFSADKDDPLVIAANELMLRYQTKAVTYRIYYHLFNALKCNTWQWISNPFICLYYKNSADVCKIKADAWDKGYNWIRTADFQYRNIIGAVTYTAVPSQEEWCKCEKKSFFTTKVIHDAPITSTKKCEKLANPFKNITCETYTKDVVKYVITNKPNDGVVLAESAGDWKGAIVKQMPKSNHQQMRSDRNTRNRLRELYNGDNGTFFQIPTK